MSLVHVITHPEVVMDPAIPVPEWRLSPTGIRRMALALEQPWMGNLGSVFSSAEREAIEAARMIADRFGLASAIVDELGENDRTATGYLPKEAFEATADAFFARPDVPIRGWERAIDAQHRIIAAMTHVIARAPARGDIAIVSHGAVGALLLCHLKRVPISRAEDQPGNGGGHVFAFERNTRALVSGWRRIED